jgi:hypothetical protein
MPDRWTPVQAVERLRPAMAKLIPGMMADIARYRDREPDALTASNIDYLTDSLYNVLTAPQAQELVHVLDACVEEFALGIHLLAVVHLLSRSSRSGSTRAAGFRASPRAAHFADGSTCPVLHLAGPSSPGSCACAGIASRRCRCVGSSRSCRCPRCNRLSPPRHRPRTRIGRSVRCRVIRAEVRASCGSAPGGNASW